VDCSYRFSEAKDAVSKIEVNDNTSLVDLVRAHTSKGPVLVFASNEDLKLAQD